MHEISSNKKHVIKLPQDRATWAIKISQGVF